MPRLRAGSSYIPARSAMTIAARPCARATAGRNNNAIVSAICASLPFIPHVLDVLTHLPACGTPTIRREVTLRQHFFSCERAAFVVSSQFAVIPQFAVPLALLQ